MKLDEKSLKGYKGHFTWSRIFFFISSLTNQWTFCGIQIINVMWQLRHILFSAYIRKNKKKINTKWIDICTKEDDGSEWFHGECQYFSSYVMEILHNVHPQLCAQSYQK